jgi:hypothetical protein
MNRGKNKRKGEKMRQWITSSDAWERKAEEMAICSHCGDTIDIGRRFIDTGVGTEKFHMLCAYKKGLVEPTEEE